MRRQSHFQPKDPPINKKVEISRNSSCSPSRFKLNGKNVRSQSVTGTDKSKSFSKFKTSRSKKPSATPSLSSTNGNEDEKEEDFNDNILDTIKRPSVTRTQSPMSSSMMLRPHQQFRTLQTPPTSVAHYQLRKRLLEENVKMIRCLFLLPKSPAQTEARNWNMVYKNRALLSIIFGENQILRCKAKNKVTFDLFSPQKKNSGNLSRNVSTRWLNNKKPIASTTNAKVKTVSWAAQAPEKMAVETNCELLTCHSIAIQENVGQYNFQRPLKEIQDWVVSEKGSFLGSPPPLSRADVGGQCDSRGSTSQGIDPIFVLPPKRIKAPKPKRASKSTATNYKWLRKSKLAKTPPPARPLVTQSNGTEENLKMDEETETLDKFQPANLDSFSSYSVQISNEKFELEPEPEPVNLNFQNNMTLNLEQDKKHEGYSKLNHMTAVVPLERKKFIEDYSRKSLKLTTMAARKFLLNCTKWAHSIQSCECQTDKQDSELTLKSSGSSRSIASGGSSVMEEGKNIETTMENWFDKVNEWTETTQEDKLDLKTSVDLKTRQNDLEKLTSDIPLSLQSSLISNERDSLSTDESSSNTSEMNRDLFTESEMLIINAIKTLKSKVKGQEDDPENFNLASPTQLISTKDTLQNLFNIGTGTTSSSVLDDQLDDLNVKGQIISLAKKSSLDLIPIQKSCQLLMTQTDKDSDMTGTSLDSSMEFSPSGRGTENRSNLTNRSSIGNINPDFTRALAQASKGRRLTIKEDEIDEIPLQTNPGSLGSISSDLEANKCHRRVSFSDPIALYKMLPLVETPAVPPALDRAPVKFRYPHQQAHKKKDSKTRIESESSSSSKMNEK